MAGSKLALQTSGILRRDQAIEPGYQNYVLYKQREEFPGPIEDLSDEKRVNETKPTSGPEPKPLARAEQDDEADTASDSDAEADGSQVGVEHQDGQRRGARIVSIFGRQK